jgi:hypothetical protein
VITPRLSRPQVERALTDIDANHSHDAVAGFASRAPRFGCARNLPAGARAVHPISGHRCFAAGARGGMQFTWPISLPPFADSIYMKRSPDTGGSGLLRLPIPLGSLVGNGDSPRNQTRAEFVEWLSASGLTPK